MYLTFCNTLSEVGSDQQKIQKASHGLSISEIETAALRNSDFFPVQTCAFQASCTTICLHALAQFSLAIFHAACASLMCNQKRFIITALLGVSPGLTARRGTACCLPFLKQFTCNCAVLVLKAYYLLKAVAAESFGWTWPWIKVSYVTVETVDEIFFSCKFEGTAWSKQKPSVLLSVGSEALRWRHSALLKEYFKWCRNYGQFVSLWKAAFTWAKSRKLCSWLTSK